MSVHIFHSGEKEGSQSLNQWNHAISHWEIDGEHLHGEPLPKGYTFVVLSPANGYNVQGTEDLATFVHPENAVYWFGSNHHHMQSDDFPREPDHIVYIPAKIYTELYSWVALTVVLYDRQVKRG